MLAKSVFWTRQGLAHCCGVDKAEGSSPRGISPLMTFQVTKAAVCEQQSAVPFQKYCCYLSANWWCPMPRQWYQAERSDDYCRKDQWSRSPQFQGILVDIPSFLTKVSEILTFIAVKQRHKNLVPAPTALPDWLQQKHTGTQEDLCSYRVLWKHSASHLHASGNAGHLPLRCGSHFFNIFCIKFHAWNCFHSCTCLNLCFLHKAGGVYHSTYSPKDTPVSL